MTESSLRERNENKNCLQTSAASDLMEPTNNWSFGQHKQFITLLRENSILWDIEHPEFIKRNKREKAWSSIQAAIGLPRHEIKAKLWSFRSKYCEIYQKSLKDANYKPTWQFFNALKFLFKHDDVATVESLSQVEQFTDDNKSYMDSYPTFIDKIDVIEETNTLYEEQVIESSMLKDEFTIFGESIANDLRIMDNYKTIKLAFKTKVMTAILEANKAVKRIKLDCNK